MDFLAQAHRISPGLADALRDVAEQPLEFRGEEPDEHSRHNHVHLWFVERMADTCREIDTAFRCRAVAYIFDTWARRLTGYRPYQSAGYRLYLLESMAPTVSVVAETPTGFPYPGEPQFVRTLADVMEPYAGHSWMANFRAHPSVDPEDILRAVEAHAGSIAAPAARRLNTTVGELRRLIEWWDLRQEVNRIRKRYRRSPGRFASEESLPDRYRVLEIRLPPQYDPTAVSRLWTSRS